MKRRLLSIALFSWIMVLPFLAGGCKKNDRVDISSDTIRIFEDEDSDKENNSDKEDEKDTNNTADNSDDKDLKNTVDNSDDKDSNDIANNSEEIDFDYEKLGVKPYSYSSSDDFELSDELKATITTMYAVVGDWKSEDVKEEGWEKRFVNSFLLNSWYEPAYVESKTNVSKEEAEYVHYSLTGQKMNFKGMDDDDFIDRSQCSSPFNYSYMDSYTLEKADEDGCTINAVIITQYKYVDDNGDLDVRDESVEISVVLAKNPYSCFEGYSIESINTCSD